MVWPGQTLEDTKISDRKKVLHISSESWSNIRSHLDKKRLAAEAIAKERAKKKAMKEESKAMVEQWPNSIMVGILSINNDIASVQTLLESIPSSKRRTHESHRSKASGKNAKVFRIDKRPGDCETEVRGRNEAESLSKNWISQRN